MPQKTEKVIIYNAQGEVLNLPKDEVQGYAGTKFSYWEQTPDIEYNAEVIRDDYLGDYFNAGVVDKMRNEPMLASNFNLLTMPVINSETIISPASDQPIDLEIADFVKYCLTIDQDHLDKTRHDLLSLPYGFMLYAYEYALIDVPGIGKKVNIRLHERKPSTIIRWEKESSPDDMIKKDKYLRAIQQIEYREFPIDLYKTQILTWQREFGNIEGRSDWRPVYSAYRDKLKAMIIILINMERFGGIPFIKGYKKSVSRESLEKLLSNLRISQRAYLALSEDEGDFDLKTSHSSGLGEQIIILNYFDNQIAKALMTAFYQLGTGSTSGSWALGDVQETPYEHKINSIVKFIANSYNSKTPDTGAYIKNLVDNNYANVQKYPKYDRQHFKKENIELVSKTYEALTKARSLGPKDELLLRKRLQVINDQIEEELKGAIKNNKTIMAQPFQKPIVINDRNVQQQANEENKNLSDMGCKCGHSHINKNFEDLISFQMFTTEVKFWREPKGAEKSVNFADLAAKQYSFSSEASKIIENYFHEVIEAFAKRFRTPMKNKDFMAIKKLDFTKEEKEGVWTELEPVLEKAVNYGKDCVFNELQRQGASVEMAESKKSNPGAVKKATQLILEGLFGKGESESQLAMLAFSSVMDETRRQAQKIAFEELRKEDPQTDAILNSIAQKSPKDFDQLGGFLVTTAINGGREEGSIIMKDEIDHGEYTAIMDFNTCQPCMELDGKPFQVGQEKKYPVPNPNCFGDGKPYGNRCRCFHVYVLKGTQKPEA